MLLAPLSGGGPYKDVPPEKALLDLLWERKLHPRGGVWVAVAWVMRMMTLTQTLNGSTGGDLPLLEGLLQPNSQEPPVTLTMREQSVGRAGGSCWITQMMRVWLPHAGRKVSAGIWRIQIMRAGAPVGEGSHQPGRRVSGLGPLIQMMSQGLQAAEERALLERKASTQMTQTTSPPPGGGHWRRRQMKQRMRRRGRRNPCTRGTLMRKRPKRHLLRMMSRIIGLFAVDGSPDLRMMEQLFGSSFPQMNMEFHLIQVSKVKTRFLFLMWTSLCLSSHSFFYPAFILRGWLWSEGLHWRCYGSRDRCQRFHQSHRRVWRHRWTPTERLIQCQQIWAWPGEIFPLISKAFHPLRFAFGVQYYHPID